MKRLLKLIVLMVPFFCMIELSANEKIYVSPEQLGVSSLGIFVNLDNEWFQAEALFSDEKGIYIQKTRIQPNGCQEGFTPCRNCDRCVKEYFDICPHCGKPV